LEFRQHTRLAGGDARPASPARTKGGSGKRVSFLRVLNALVVPLARLGEEGLEVVGDNSVQNGPLRLMSLMGSVRKFV